ncbi:MAG: glycosyltransferase family 39 protein [Candidatus Omnitrophota bacterium]
MGRKGVIACVLVFLALFTALELYVACEKPPQIAEGWFSDIAYNLNPELTGMMGNDIPWAKTWSCGIGKLFFAVHYLSYKIFGLGIFQARLGSFVSGYLLLLLVFFWVRKNVSFEAAVLSAALLSVSPSWWTYLADARQDFLHNLFAFISFYLLSTGFMRDKRQYIAAGGLMAALSVDIDYRGVEIVMMAFLYVLSTFDRKKTGAYLCWFFAGSFIAFIIWFSVNVIPMGLSNFVNYHIAGSVGDGGPVTMLTFLSEFFRLGRYAGTAAGLAKIEIAYWAALLILFYQNRGRYASSSQAVKWMVSCFVVMSLIERTTYPSHMLMYSPFIAILGGIGLESLLNARRKLGSVFLASVLVFGLFCQGARAGKYFYHRHIAKDYDPAAFGAILRSSVDPDKGIIGDVTNWYFFPDERYYGGPLYLNRVLDVLGEFKLPGEYADDTERARAMLDVFRKRQIEYIIANRHLKEYIAAYFPGDKLPEKNFLLVGEATDYFLGDDAAEHPVETEIYRIISYEP